jgi:hypothetical protein
VFYSESEPSRPESWQRITSGKVEISCVLQSTDSLWQTLPGGGGSLGKRLNGGMVPRMLKAHPEIVRLPLRAPNCFNRVMKKYFSQPHRRRKRLLHNRKSIAYKPVE